MARDPSNGNRMSILSNVDQKRIVCWWWADVDLGLPDMLC